MPVIELSGYDYLNYFVVGQENIKKELGIYLEEIVRGRNINILLRASSGQGKTHIGHACGNFINYQTERKNYYYYLAYDGLELKTGRVLQFIDEVHLLEVPEILYPDMDKGNYSFILSTNEYDLKEPLLNRCAILTLNPYSQEELAEIAQLNFQENKIFLSGELLPLVVLNSKSNPRMISKNCFRLSLIFEKVGIPQTIENLSQIFLDFMGIENGFNEMDRIYIENLQKLGRASLDSLASQTSIPKKIIVNEIEPYLIKNRMMEITSRGRIWMN